jgi:glutamyl-Q tRNA(Asp) synthetase
LNSLESHGLLWDNTALHQSQRLGAYQVAFEALNESIYACDCIRQRILSLNGRYDGHCRHSTPTSNAAVAWRLNTSQHPHLFNVSEHFKDIFLGRQHLALDSVGDFIVRRKDTLFSYQLAVAVDDLFQQITHVIRGQDLLDSTYRQRYLLLLLTAQQPELKARLADDLPPATCPDFLPQYGHTPLALGDDGHKLSKQTKASPIDDAQSAVNLIAALAFLGQQPPNELLTKPVKNHLNSNNNQQHCTEILAWAVDNWNRGKVPSDSSVAPTLADA